MGELVGELVGDGVRTGLEQRFMWWKELHTYIDVELEVDMEVDLEVGNCCTGIVA